MESQKKSTLILNVQEKNNQVQSMDCFLTQSSSQFTKFFNVNIKIKFTSFVIFFDIFLVFLNFKKQ